MESKLIRKSGNLPYEYNLVHSRERGGAWRNYEERNKEAFYNAVMCDGAYHYGSMWQERGWGR